MTPSAASDGLDAVTGVNVDLNAAFPAKRPANVHVMITDVNFL
jgi:hypothetical protein